MAATAMSRTEGLLCAGHRRPGWVLSGSAATATTLPHLPQPVGATFRRETWGGGESNVRSRCTPRDCRVWTFLPPCVPCSNSSGEKPTGETTRLTGTRRTGGVRKHLGGATEPWQRGFSSSDWTVSRGQIQEQKPLLRERPPSICEHLPLTCHILLYSRGNISTRHYLRASVRWVRGFITSSGQRYLDNVYLRHHARPPRRKPGICHTYSLHT